MTNKTLKKINFIFKIMAFLACILYAFFEREYFFSHTQAKIALVAIFVVFAIQFALDIRFFIKKNYPKGTVSKESFIHTYGERILVLDIILYLVFAIYMFGFSTYGFLFIFIIPWVILSKYFMNLKS